MKQLDGVDAAFLYTELKNSPMHVGGLAIYDPSTAPRKPSLQDKIGRIVERGRKISELNDVLVSVPLNLDHPYWSASEPFDASYHIRHVKLPKPGNWKQLRALVAKLHARPLDRSHPLWEFYVIDGIDAVDGYPKGSFGLLSKIHHATIDGAAGAQIGAVIHDLEPASEAGTEDDSVMEFDRAPSVATRLLRAQGNNLRYPARLLRGSMEVAPRLGRTLAGVVRRKLPVPSRVPRTRFNGVVSANRVFDSARFQLSDLIELKKPYQGVTLNDVALTICAGALRAYLERDNELPDRPMIAAVPVNLRSEDENDLGGNQVTNMSVSLRTDLADPLERLLAISEASKAAKSFTASLGGRTLNTAIKLIPPPVTAPMAKVSGRLKLTRFTPPSFNCSITNVPQSRVPLYFCGAQMLSNFGIGPIMDGIGVFHIINSYCDELSISFCSCPEMIPDSEAYVQDIESSAAELRAAMLSGASR